MHTRILESGGLDGESENWSRFLVEVKQSSRWFFHLPVWDVRKIRVWNPRAVLQMRPQIWDMLLLTKTALLSLQLACSQERMCYMWNRSHEFSPHNKSPVREHMQKWAWHLLSLPAIERSNVIQSVCALHWKLILPVDLRSVLEFLSARPIIN